MADFTDPLLASIPETRDALPASHPDLTHHDPDPSSDPDRDDVDTCRICRGEGTVDEPLFYPCKCSGSIKYVHQECLMEWLSHTQKKHCELCKTPFRFTKLYHPGMPNRIPTTVFLRRAALHAFNMFLTWCRAVLVAGVWIVLLPWCMRVVWRSLFWVGDGGWSPHDHPHQEGSLNGRNSATANASNTSPVHNFTASVNATKHVPSFLLMSMTRWFLRTFSYSIISPQPSGPHLTVHNATFDPLGSRDPSLLSGIPFLNWFPSQAANQFLIDVLEGQIITLLVVVAFILIFLIREWVVQQQPVINMLALGDNAAAAQRANPENEPRVGVAPDQGDDEQDDEVPSDEEDNDSIDINHPTSEGSMGARRASTPRPDSYTAGLPYDDSSVGLNTANNSIGPENAVYDEQHDARRFSLRPLPVGSDLRAASSPAYTSRNATSQRSYDSNDVGQLATSYDLLSLPNDHAAFGEHDASPASHRPNMPARNQSFVAADINRSIEEHTTWSFNNVSQAPEEVTWPNSPVLDSWEDEDLKHSAHLPQPLFVTNPDQDSEHSSGSWQQVPQSSVMDSANQVLEGEQTQDKGKARMDDGTEGSTQDLDAISIQGAKSHTSGTEYIERESEVHAVNESSDPDAVQQRMIDDQIAVNAPSNQDTSATTDTDSGLAAPADAQEPAQDVLNQMLDWMFGDVAPAAQAAEDDRDDEHIVRNLAEEAPFVPFLANEPRAAPDLPDQDPEVAAAAAQAGIDLNEQDAIEDAEDLEGILELIGMQGPVVGLFQNALFSAVLISATLACAIWLPYLLGKIVILFMGSPVVFFVKLPLRIITTGTDLVVDIALAVVAGLTFWSSQAVMFLANAIFSEAFARSVQSSFQATSTRAQSLSGDAAERIIQLLPNARFEHPPDYLRLSINSHAALRNLQNVTSSAMNATGNVISTTLEKIASDSPLQLALRIVRRFPSLLYHTSTAISSSINAVFTWLSTSKSYNVTLDLDLLHNVTVPYPPAEYWTASDRVITILVGYIFFALLGVAYLRRGTPLSSSPQGQRIERVISEILQQAGGVIKVILIISIEMLAFPLYCGLLLDLAMLPLFKNASVFTRWQFAKGSPWTSGFVHWFIGTCYMFHFALFVSMCRKIMRKGVLYFIRDPDDPTFHPVRDVLERSVTTQLRKITFSALVYGALVIVCLGGVIWTLSQATSGVLPIHWTTEAPSLEFPLDLLFYNFLTPVIIKFYKPNESLHAVCKWWFQSCARLLRLSSFLFGETVQSKSHLIEGKWFNWFGYRKSNEASSKGKENAKDEAELAHDGKYVRAPASDQTRIPKGHPVFVEVDQNNVRLDGKTEGGVHNTDMVTMVHIPSWFRLRIFCFIITIWIFMGISGVGVTILPLLFGRYLFSLVLPPSVEMNDIHAFSLGVYTIGSLAYSGYHIYTIASSLSQPSSSPLSALRNFASTTTRIGLKALRFAYVWAALIFAIPFLSAIIIELYFLMPLHAYLGPTEPHVVHIIQDWTLGFLYSRLVARLVFADRTSRPARAFAAVIRDGYLHPNALLATKCFMLPVLALFAAAVAVPSSLAFVMTRTLYAAADATVKNQVWRFSFPAVGSSLVAMWAAQESVRMLGRWRMVVRDEVYLIGERLHNFGEKRAVRIDVEDEVRGGREQNVAR